jgi:hypothetical protein
MILAKRWPGEGLNIWLYPYVRRAAIYGVTKAKRIARPIRAPKQETRGNTEDPRLGTRVGLA